MEPPQHEHIVRSASEIQPHSAGAEWTRGGSTRMDLAQDVDADSVDVVEVIESHKVWEHIKMPLLCTLCKDPGKDAMIPNHVHWSYTACQTCEDVYICADCFPTQRFEDFKVQKHPQCTFIHLTVRPLSAPIYDGTDLDQLKAFKDAQNSKRFFALCPWLFHCFPEFDKSREASRAQAIEALKQPGIDAMDKMAISYAYKVPTDWYVRMFGRWQWEGLLQSMMPLIDVRIQVATVSKRLYLLLTDLQRFNHEKIRSFGLGDIKPPELPSGYAQMARTFSSSMQDFNIYCVPLQFLTIFDSDINLAELRKVDLLRGEDRQTSTHISALLDDELIRSLGNPSKQWPPVAVHSYLDGVRSKNKFPDSIRLWHMFNIIFGTSAEFDDLTSTFPHLDYSNYLGKLKPEWYGFLTRTKLTRDLLNSLVYDSLPEIPQHDLQLLQSTRPSFWPESYKHATRLRQALKTRKRSAYGESIKLLTEDHLDYNGDLFILLELQNTFLSQGNYLKARDCRLIVPDAEVGDIETTTAEINDTQQIARRLLHLVSAYADGFVRGYWSEALDQAYEVFQTYLRSWQMRGEDVVLVIYLELYYHRIALNAARDLNVHLDTTSAIMRLRSITQRLCLMPGDSNLAPLTWDVLSVELDLGQRALTKRYFDFEDSFSVPAYGYNAQTVVSAVSSFLLSRVVEESAMDNKYTIVEALIFEADVCLDENFELAKAKGMISAAEKLLNVLDHNLSPGENIKHAGHLDVEALRLHITGVTSSDDFKRLQNLYAELRTRNDVARLRKLRPRHIGSPVRDENAAAYEWLFYQKLSLQELAQEAGDMVACERWKLRKYAGDDQTILAITDAERVLHEGHLYSNLLWTIASFNLSRAYLRTGNYLEASLNALLHQSLSAERDEAEPYQRAVLNVLQVFSETIHEQKGDCEAVIVRLANAWNGWLTDGPYDRWTSGGPRCDEIDRFIDAACFLPNLAIGLNRKQNYPDKPFNEKLVEKMLDHLHIAFQLYEALPTYFASTVLPKLSLAIGAIAVYIGNKELAIRTYHEGLESVHSQDLVTRAYLRLQAGNLMTRLGEEDPEHWLYIVPAGRGLLKAVADEFLTLGNLSGSLFNSCTARVKLLESLVCEARWKKFELDDDLSGANHLLSREFAERFGMIATLWNRAQDPIVGTEVIIGRIAQNVNFLKPFEASRNLATLSSKRMILRNRELALEMNLIVLDIDKASSDRPWGGIMWPTIQRYKGSAMHQRHYSQLVPNHLLDAIKSNPRTWDLYMTEQMLLKQGLQSLGDFRLGQVRAEMYDHPATHALIQYRKGIVGVDANEFGPVQDAVALTFENPVDVVLIDWIYFHDIFLVIGFSTLKNQVSFFKQCTDITIAEVEGWIQKHMKVPGQLLDSTLHSLDVFKPLFPLVSQIKTHCNPGDLLVFCPSQQLHAIPLHALPYDIDVAPVRPIINVHPVVYAPSQNILKQCVRRVREERHEVSTARLFGRWGSMGDQPSFEEQRIESVIQSVAAQLQQVNIDVEMITGSAVTHEVITNNMRTASILHYHGHVEDGDLKQHLVLESAPVSLSTATADNNNISHPYYGRKPSKRTDTYTLQDAFANEIQASLVTLLGCGSGTQHVSESDDAMGMISAFLAAGATSVIASLWPLNSSDASKFANKFYHNAFVANNSTDKQNLINLATALKATVMEMQACQRPACQRYSQEKRMRCHISESMSPFHWSQFVLWGSWFCGRTPGPKTETSAEEGRQEKSKEVNMDIKFENLVAHTNELNLATSEKSTSASGAAPKSAKAAPSQTSKSSSSRPKPGLDDLFRAAKGKKWLL